VPLRERERRDRIRRQARQLAGQGRLANWREVQSALERKGSADAPAALASTLVRVSLDVRCALSRLGHARAS
jgi:hypothetical protein